MKKFLFLLVIVLILAGCTMTNEDSRLTENEIKSNSQGYSESDVINQINNIKNGATPQVKPSKSTNNTMTNNDTKTPEEGQIQLEDLAKSFNGVKMKTNKGDITIKLYGDLSPLTVNNFLNLAKKDFYNDILFHRVIPDFMIQGGDPNSKNDDWNTHGTGGPGYKFQDEFNNQKLVRGSLAMANSGPNTNGSQFFIVTAEATPWLDGKHTNFGEVVEGMDVVDAIEAIETNARDHPLEDVKIEDVELIKL